MNNRFKLEITGKLKEMAPTVPFYSTRKSRSKLIDELFQLAPKEPFKKVSGIELLQELNVPLKPN